MQVIDSSRQIMRKNGNMNQWTDGYPSKDIILDDISNGNHFSVWKDDAIVGVFTFIKGPDITYKSIYDGNWSDDKRDYYVIHRAGKLQGCNGVLKEILDYCFRFADSIKVDTHRDNKIMQHLLEKYGFTYCGIIYLLNGDERLAYQKIIN
ncbi:MAG: GNAT family N-acetyltransferase [Bacteroidales bacterium]|nr:GNAT family N-acetyltransferase [Bacteroidales bacterium]